LFWQTAAGKHRVPGGTCTARVIAGKSLPPAEGLEEQRLTHQRRDRGLLARLGDQDGRLRPRYRDSNPPGRKKFRCAKTLIAACNVDRYTGAPRIRPKYRIAGEKGDMGKGKPSRRRTAADLQGSRSNPAAKLGPDIKDKIGQQLRLMYDDVVSQGVPDRFLEILRDLDPPPNGGAKKSS
jgi:Anti-sigma factor NepR